MHLSYRKFKTILLMKKIRIAILKNNNFMKEQIKLTITTEIYSYHILLK